MHSKEVFTGLELKEVMRRQHIASFEWHSYEGMWDGTPEELEDGQLYRVVSFKEKEYGVFRVRIIDSLAELLAFRQKISSMDSEEALVEIVEWEYIKGNTLEELLLFQQHNVHSSSDLFYFCLADDIDEDTIQPDAWYYLSGEEIHRSEWFPTTNS